jgi:hypothetical protein
MKSKPNEPHLLHKPFVSTTYPFDKKDRNQANQTDIGMQSAMSKNPIDLDDDDCR